MIDWLLTYLWLAYYWSSNHWPIYNGILLTYLLFTYLLSTYYWPIYHIDLFIILTCWLSVYILRSCDLSDKVTVSIQVDNSYPETLMVLCGTKLPPAIMSNGPFLQLRFEAMTKNSQARGFKFQYQFVTGSFLSYITTQNSLSALLFHQHSTLYHGQIINIFHFSNFRFRNKSWWSCAIHTWVEVKVQSTPHLNTERLDCMTETHSILYTLLLSCKVWA